MLLRPGRMIGSVPTIRPVPNLITSVHQTFAGALTAAGLAANDGNAEFDDTDWSVVNVNGNLSVGAAAAMAGGGLINGAAEVSTQGLIFDCAAGAADDDSGLAQLVFPGVDALSAALWFRFPAAINDTDTTHAIFRIQDDVDDRQPLFHLINTGDADTKLHLFVWQQGNSPGVDVAPDTPYYLTMGWTRSGGASGIRFRVYDATGAQVGAEQTRIAGDSQMQAMIIGNFGSGGPVAGDFHYAGLNLDLVDGTFPLGPAIA